MGETCLPKRTDPNAFRHISHGSAMSHHQLCHFHTHVQVYTHPRGAGQTWICHPAVSAGSQLWHSRGSRHSLRPHKSLTVKPAPGSKAGFSLASRQKGRDLVPPFQATENSATSDEGHFQLSDFSASWEKTKPNPTSPSLTKPGFRHTEIKSHQDSIQIF